MASMVDSVATFKARVADLGLIELWPKLEEYGYTTYAGFAFSSSYAPGNPDETLFITEVVEPLAGDNKAMRPKLRRLLFESHTFLTAELQAAVERKDGDKPTKMTRAEREARKDGIKPHMIGLNTDHEHDAAHCLVD